MVPDRVIYTDGHDVTVTDSTLQVNKSEYRLNGITKHDCSFTAPTHSGHNDGYDRTNRHDCRILRVIPSTWINDTVIRGTAVSGSTIALVTGASIAIIGVLLLGMIRQRYSVRIATAEGEKDVVVSSRKEYIQQIVDALNSAYNYIRDNV
jgi:hypothetical protein